MPLLAAQVVICSEAYWADSTGRRNTGLANRHGRLVADVIAGRAVAAKPVMGTAIVGAFGIVAASTGWTEKRAIAAGRKVRVIHTHRPTTPATTPAQKA